jgi:hypothetical protein
MPAVARRSARMGGRPAAQCHPASGRSKLAWSLAELRIMTRIVNARNEVHGVVALACRLLLVNALALACSACLSQPGAKVADAATGAPPAPNRLPSLRDTSESTIVSKQGRPYRILVSTPRGPRPPEGFPVIYVLDAEAWFGVAVEIVRMREYSKLSPAIVVGVGYPGSSFFDVTRRSFDFTPPGSVERDMQEAGIELGGADLFLAFFEDTLKPWASRRCSGTPSVVCSSCTRCSLLRRHSTPGWLPVPLSGSPTRSC